MICVKQHELKNSYAKHYNFYRHIDGYDKSRRLLLFYAVECGLKCLMLKNIGQNTTDDLFQYAGYARLRDRGHDVKLMVKLLGFEGQFNFKRIPVSGNRMIDPADYNQLWRYGIETTEVVTEKQEETTLASIAEWLQNKL